MKSVLFGKTEVNPLHYSPFCLNNTTILAKQQRQDSPVTIWHKQSVTIQTASKNTGYTANALVHW